MNRHSCIYSALENPYATIKQELNAPDITVWAGIWSGGILAPLFLRHTDTSDGCLETLEEIIPIGTSKLNSEEMFLMQDGVSPHSSSCVCDFFGREFPTKVDRSPRPQGKDASLSRPNTALHPFLGIN